MGVIISFNVTIYLSLSGLCFLLRLQYWRVLTGHVGILRGYIKGFSDKLRQKAYQASLSDFPELKIFTE